MAAAEPLTKAPSGCLHMSAAQAARQAGAGSVTCQHAKLQQHCSQHSRVSSWLPQRDQVTHSRKKAAAPGGGGSQSAIHSMLEGAQGWRQSTARAVFSNPSDRYCC